MSTLVLPVVLASALLFVATAPAYSLSTADRSPEFPTLFSYLCDNEIDQRISDSKPPVRLYNIPNLMVSATYDEWRVEKHTEILFDIRTQNFLCWQGGDIKDSDRSLIHAFVIGGMRGNADIAIISNVNIEGVDTAYLIKSTLDHITFSDVSIESTTCARVSLSTSVRIASSFMKNCWIEDKYSDGLNNEVLGEWEFNNSVFLHTLFQPDILRYIDIDGSVFIPQSPFDITENNIMGIDVSQIRQCTQNIIVWKWSTTPPALDSRCFVFTYSFGNVESARVENDFNIHEWPLNSMRSQLINVDNFESKSKIMKSSIENLETWQKKIKKNAIEGYFFSDGTGWIESGQ